MSSQSKEKSRAVVSFLTTQRKLGRKTRDRVIRDALDKETKEFFAGFLDNDTERKLWMIFITGRAPRLDPMGHTIEDPDLGLLMEEVDLNPLMLKAFLQAVAYKRGTPTVMMQSKGDTTNNVSEMTWQVMGPSQDVLRQQAVAAGLLPDEIAAPESVIITPDNGSQEAT